MNNVKCELIEGKIIDLENTNVNFIEPHQVVIRVKSYIVLVLSFDKDYLFLYDRMISITIRK